MFAVNLKFPHKATLLLIIACLAALLFIITFRFEKNDAMPADTVSVNDSFSVADYVASFGVETDAESLIIDEVTIPTDFNDVYEAYNSVQKQQGFNLEGYKGRTLLRYTMRVTNYTDSTKEVYVEVMTYRSKAVAADIYCTDADGFISALK